MQPLYNCHVHIFTSDAVPDGFLPLGYMRVVRTKAGAAVTRALFNKLAYLTGWPRLVRAVSFSEIGSLETQEEILENLAGFYPVGTRFVVLPMDMEYMGAGRAPQSYLAQLDELRALYEKPRWRDVLLPFVAVDPRREGLLELIRTYIEQHRFRGIKVYPPLGFYPFDAKLDAVWAYAQGNQVPVLVHCSRGGVYARRITEEMRRDPDTGRRIGGKPKDFTDRYTDPANWVRVLEKYKGLRLCLAHFGGGSEWRSYLRTPRFERAEKSWLIAVRDLISRYDHVYTDIAYTACDRDHHPLLKVLINTPELREKILYGSDYYMVQMDVSEREFSINLRAFLGEDDYAQIAVANPRRFFGDSS